MRRIILTDLDRGTVHEFRDSDVRIGRDAACELQIAEAPASAEIGSVHARLAPRPTGWCLTDERSAGGTFVNHVRLVGNDQAILRTGDVLRLGSGAGARRFRVARVESAMAPKQAPPAVAVPAATQTVRTEASDLRLAAGAIGGAVAATAAAVPRATNAQLAGGAAAGTAVASAGVAAASGLAAKGKGAKGPTGRQTSGAALSGAAAAGAVAATGGVAGVAAVGGGTEAWRASTIFRAAGDSAALAPKASAASLWAGVVAGTVLVTAAATGIASARRPGETGDRAPTVAATVGTASAAASGASAASESGSAESKASATAGDAAPTGAARLSSTAAAVGNILADLEGWRGGTRVRLTGLVVGEGGVMVTSDALGASGRLDSLVARTPYGGVHRGQLVSRAAGVAVVSVPSWDGQWLGPSAVGSATTIPTWSAVIGYDRMNAKTTLAAAEGAAAVTSTVIEVRGVSDRLLPGGALVSEDGRVVGLWLGDGHAMPMQQVLAAARGAGQRPH